MGRVKISRVAGWTLLLVLTLALIVVPFVVAEGAVFDASRKLLAAPAGRASIASVAIVMLATDLFLPIPSSFVAAGAVTALGGTLGAIVIWLGLTAAALLGYVLGRFGGTRLAQRVVGRAELERASHLHRRFGALVVIVCRGVPVLAEASTVFAGALGMRFWKFLLVASFSNLGLSLAYASFSALGTGVLAVLAPFALGIALPALALALVGRLERTRRARSGSSALS